MFGNEYVENVNGTTGNVQNKQIGYTYDDNGNVIAEEIVNNPLAETEYEQGKELTKYTYDSYNRLVREDNPDFGTTCYVYDDKGNIVKKYWRAYTTAIQ